MKPHPATVVQPRAPHPATVAQPRPVRSGPSARPPHPATIAQPRAAPASAVARPPHPATVGGPAARLAGAVQRASDSKSQASAPASNVDYDALFRKKYHLAPATDLSDVHRVKVSQIVLSPDMRALLEGGVKQHAVKAEFVARLYKGATVDYKSPYEKEKLLTIIDKEFQQDLLQPISVVKYAVTDDGTNTQLYQIANGRHRFIMYVVTGFDDVPVRIG